MSNEHNAPKTNAGSTIVYGPSGSFDPTGSGSVGSKGTVEARDHQGRRIVARSILANRVGVLPELILNSDIDHFLTADKAYQNAENCVASVGFDNKAANKAANDAFRIRNAILSCDADRARYKEIEAQHALAKSVKAKNDAPAHNAYDATPPTPWNATLKTAHDKFAKAMNLADRDQMANEPNAIGTLVVAARHRPGPTSLAYES